jgi:hypothetical protein
MLKFTHYSMPSEANFEKKDGKHEQNAITRTISYQFSQKVPEFYVSYMTYTITPHITRPTAYKLVQPPCIRPYQKQPANTSRNTRPTHLKTLTRLFREPVNTLFLPPSEEFFSPPFTVSAALRLAGDLRAHIPPNPGLDRYLRFVVRLRIHG